MPLDDDQRWGNYRNLIMSACDAVHQAIVDLPIWAQYAVLGANLGTILKPLSEKQRAIDALNFIRTLTKNINDKDENQDEATCQDS